MNYVASSLFDIITLIITDKLDSAKKGKLEGLYGVIVECKWQVCIVVGMLALALVFQPQLASLITALIP